MCVKVKKLATLVMDMMPRMRRMVNMETGFVKKCGKCYDPCALRFKPMMKGKGGRGMDDESDEDFMM